MCFFITQLQLNECKQTVGKIKYFINQQILNIKLYLGTPFQAVYVKLDLNGQYPLISDLQYNSNDSRTHHLISKEDVTVYNLTFHGEVIQDICVLNQNDLKLHYTFIVVNTNFNRYIASLPLSYHFSNPSYSLVRRLKESSLINKEAFYIEPTSRDGGFFHMGMTDDIKKVINNSKYRGKCDVINYQNQWMCILISIRVNDILYTVNRFVTFHSDIQRSIVPDSFITFLGDFVLKELIKEKKCEINVYPLPPKRRYITCNLEKNERNIFDIALTFIDTTLVVNFENLMYCVANSCLVLFESDEEKGDMFIFGYSLLIQFTTGFDYENKEVSFYSDTNRIISKYNRSSHLLPLLLINSIVLLIWIAGLLIQYKRIF